MGEQHARRGADPHFCAAPTEGGEELPKHKRKGGDGKQEGPGLSRGLRERGTKISRRHSKEQPKNGLKLRGGVAGALNQIGTRDKVDREVT